jgi:hypothetical protein
MKRPPILTALALLLPLGACGGDSSSSTGEETRTGDATTPPLPEVIDVPDPDDRVTRLELVEDESEQVADRLLAFSDKVRRRDFAAARSWLADDFAGHDMGDLPLGALKTRALDVEERVADVSAPPVVGPDEFLEGVAALISPWARVDSVVWKVKTAEFQRGRPHWGKVKLFIHMTGRGERGGGESVSAWGYTRVELVGKDWMVSRFELTSLTTSRRAGPVFSAVATAAGVGHVSTRFGKPGNQSFAFNGAACGDVDGDGDFDLFVPSDGRNYLYINGPEGFTEDALARGVAQPDGGTGTVLFDLDNDGDQDLVVGHVNDGATAGTHIELYTNEGGSFTRVEGGLGLGKNELAAYSLTVLDYDLDGWLDLFVCGYGITAEEHNNSWIQATNGAPNALFRNEGGKSFVDVAPDLGLAGHSWSYAAAAADYDDDGDTDFYVANDYGTNNLWRNDGGSFTDVAEELGVLDQGNGMGCTFGDLSGDGVLDLYVSNMSSTAGNRILDRYAAEIDPEVYAVLKKSAAGNTIFIQGSDGTFTRAPKKAGGVGANWAWAAAITDFDLDGRLDVFCTNGFVTGDQAFDT